MLHDRYIPDKVYTRIYIHLSRNVYEMYKRIPTFFALFLTSLWCITLTGRRLSYYMKWLTVFTVFSLFRVSVFFHIARLVYWTTQKLHNIFCFDFSWFYRIEKMFSRNHESRGNSQKRKSFSLNKQIPQLHKEFWNSNAEHTLDCKFTWHAFVFTSFERGLLLTYRENLQY